MSRKKTDELVLAPSKCHKTSFSSKSAQISVHFTGLVLASLIAIGVFFSIFDRSDPIEWLRTEVTPTHVHPGDRILITIEARILRDNCRGDVLRYFVDSSGIRHQYNVTPTMVRPTRETSSIEGAVVFHREIRIPQNIAPGIVRHGVIITYRCNPFHSWFPIVIEREYGTFVVVPRQQPQPPPTDRRW